jgi:CrcB protein
MTWLLAALGGGVGALLRFVFSGVEARVFAGRERPNDARGTLISNLVACFVVGLAIGGLAAPDAEAWRALMIVGFCGGLSTYSSFARELWDMIGERRWARVAGISALNIVCGTLLLWAGYALTA